MQTMDRTIAETAKTLVKGIEAGNASEYRSFCEGFPVLLRSAGLNQTLAFLQAKGGNPHGTLYKHIETHFRNLKMLGDKQSLGDLVVNPTLLPMREYRMFSRIALRIAFWHKRMVQALLKDRQDGAQS